MKKLFYLLCVFVLLSCGNSIKDDTVTFINAELKTSITDFWLGDEDETSIKQNIYVDGECISVDIEAPANCCYRKVKYIANGIPVKDYVLFNKTNDGYTPIQLYSKTDKESEIEMEKKMKELEDMSPSERKAKLENDKKELEKKRKNLMKLKQKIEETNKW